MGKVLAQSEINPDNGKPHLVLSMFFYDGGDLRPSVHLTTPDAQTVHMWSDDIYSVLTADGRAGYTEGNSDCSMGELGGTGNRIISVGAYTTRDHRFNYGIYYPSKFGEADDIASFSSHGPTVDGRLKPDIAAPGAYIISSFSSYFTGTKYRESPIIWNDKKYELGYNAGTSMASPLVAGVLATWLQARPDMTPEEVRAILSRTGRADKFAQDLPNQIWGYGKIDALSGIKEVLSMPAGIDEHVTAKRPHLLSLVNGLATAVLSTPATRAALNLYAPDGRLVKTIKAKYLERGESLTLETNGLQGGAYLLQLATNNETQTLKVLIY